jgi:hypothetical protein
MDWHEFINGVKAATQIDPDDLGNEALRTVPLYEKYLRKQMVEGTRLAYSGTNISKTDWKIPTRQQAIYFSGVIKLMEMRERAIHDAIEWRKLNGSQSSMNQAPPSKT